MSTGVVHWDLLPQGQTMNSDVYCTQLDQVQQKLLENGINPAQIFFQQDNARPHCSKQTPEKLNELGWELPTHPPYSPNIASTDYHLFRLLEHFMRGQWFNNECDLQQGIASLFSKKSTAFYHRGISMLRHVGKWLLKVMVNMPMKICCNCCIHFIFIIQNLSAY